MAERGKYQTKQQEAITAYFRQSPEQCVTVETLYAQLGAKIGMTTMYRAVARLCEEGVLRKYAPQSTGEAALYQYNPCRESHLHIRCVDCGRLVHLHCEEVHEFGQHLLEHHGFVLDEGQTILYGRCETCEKRRRAQKEEL